MLNPKVIGLVLGLVQIIKENRELIFTTLDNVADKTANEVDDEVVKALAKLFDVDLPDESHLEKISKELDVAQTKYDNKKEEGKDLAESTIINGSVAKLADLLKGTDKE